MAGDGISLFLTSASANLGAVGTPLGKGERAARDFEAILLTQLMDSLEKTFSCVAQDPTPGASDYRHMATQALASKIGEQGGIGIAQLILRHLPDAKVQAKP